MKKLSALVVLSMAGLAVSASPAQAENLSFGHGAADATKSWNVTTTDLCHRDMAGYPVVGPVVDHTTGMCDVLGDTIDHPQF
jgi:hypothetical protein